MKKGKSKEGILTLVVNMDNLIFIKNFMRI